MDLINDIVSWVDNTCLVELKSAKGVELEYSHQKERKNKDKYVMDDVFIN